MGARTRPLPADEIAVGSRDGPRTGRHALAIGRDAQAAAGLTPFEAGLAEHPVESLGLASRFTRSDPGTIQAVTWSALWRPLATAAAARRSEMRLLVQEPMNTQSTLVPSIGLPGSSP